MYTRQPKGDWGTAPRAVAGIFTHQPSSFPHPDFAILKKRKGGVNRLPAHRLWPTMLLVCLSLFVQGVVAGATSC